MCLQVCVIPNNEIKQFMELYPNGTPLGRSKVHGKHKLYFILNVYMLKHYRMCYTRSKP